MSIKAIITKRRSIRKYQAKKVSDVLIKELINAARLAPSGNNAQPARYFIVQDEKIKQKLKENKVFKQEFVYQAPVIIVCCGNPEVYPKEKLEPGFDDSFQIRAVRDVSIAAQNLVLRATELGLGTCYIG
jgi:nitroreductase